VPPLNALPGDGICVEQRIAPPVRQRHVDAERVKSLLSELHSSKASLDANALAYAVRKHLDN